MSRVNSCPSCTSTSYRPHCASRLCFWLVCKACGTTWDYISGQSVERSR